MNSLIRSRIASVITVALGAWLMLSPLFIAVTGAALISLLVSGGIIVQLVTAGCATAAAKERIDGEGILLLKL